MARVVMNIDSLNSAKRERNLEHSETETKYLPRLRFFLLAILVRKLR